MVRIEEFIESTQSDDVTIRLVHWLFVRGKIVRELINPARGVKRAVQWLPSLSVVRVIQLISI